MDGFEEFQKIGKANLDMAFRSFGEAGKGFQAIAAEVNDYSRHALEEGAATFEKLMGAESFEQAVAVQSDYARKAYEEYVSRASRIGEMYVDMARAAYKPAESAFARKA